MPIEFHCPHCEQPYRVPDDRAGATAECRTCGQMMTVPSRSIVEPAAPRDEEAHAAIAEHVERTAGSVDGVFRDLVEDSMRIDVHRIPPNEDRPSVTLLTVGCSDRPMHVPSEILETPTYCELSIQLPRDWPLDAARLADDAHAWPLRLLKELARLPHARRSWLGPWQTIPNGDPPAPYAAHVPFSSVLLLPATGPHGFADLVLGPTKRIAFLQVLPLFPEEVTLVLDQGPAALTERLRRSGIPPIVDVDRPNVGKRRFGLT